MLPFLYICVVLHVNEQTVLNKYISLLIILIWFTDLVCAFCIKKKKKKEIPDQSTVNRLKFIYYFSQLPPPPPPSYIAYISKLIQGPF